MEALYCNSPHFAEVSLWQNHNFSKKVILSEAKNLAFSIS
jgi:hypothetical protein